MRGLKKGDFLEKIGFLGHLSRDLEWVNNHENQFKGNIKTCLDCWMSFSGLRGFYWRFLGAFLYGLQDTI